MQRTVHRIIGNVSHLTDEDIDKIKARLAIEKASMSKSQLSKKLKVNSSLVNEIMKSKDIPTVKGAAGYDLVTPDGIRTIEKYVKEKNSDRKKQTRSNNDEMKAFTIKVAELVSEGLSNIEISDRLNVTLDRVIYVKRFRLDGSEIEDGFSNAFKLMKANKGVFKGGYYSQQK